MNRLTARLNVARHLHRHRGLGAAAALTLTLVLGACSSAGSSTTSASGASPSSGSTGEPSSAVLPQQAGSGVTFHGKVQVTGALKFANSFTEKDTSVSSCADVATKGDAAGGTFAVPSPYATQNPQIIVRLAHFHGAGTYPPTEMQADKSDAIWLKSGGHTDEYVLTTHPAALQGQTMGKEVLFLMKDGSGELAFSGAHKLGQKSSPAIAGLISWTCSD
jgi:hypothetical protein